MAKTFQKPAFYCGQCTNVLTDDATHCPDCEKRRPEKGWRSFQDGYDRWLGRILDDRYLITKRVGQGSVGSVYRAKSLAIERVFAIKIINLKQTPDGLSAEEIRARLNREVSVIGKLRNPHIVPFYETLELYDTFIGIVMDYVEGETLESLVNREHPMSFERIMNLLKQISNGLYEAHQAGMTHRDLKPENFMVERLPAQGDFLHILDFGIVRVEDGVSLTRGFLGTPLYASPEQATAGKIDHRSDLYSLGAVLFFMLTGQAPYQSENVYEILRSHVGADVPIPSGLRSDVPEFIDRLTTRLLAKRPQDRPSSLAEVITDINTFLLMSARDSSEYRTIRETDSSGNPPVAGTSTAGNETSDLDPVPQKKREASGAAIFKRAPTRGTIGKEIESYKRERENFKFDYTIKTESGIQPLGRGGEIVSCVSKDGTIISLNTDNEIWRYNDDKSLKIAHLSFSPTTINPVGEKIWAGSEDGKIIEVEAQGHEEEIFADVRRAPIRAIDFRAGVGLAGSDSGRVYLRKEDGIWMRIQNGPPVLGVAISQDGTVFAIALKTNEINIFRSSDPKRARVTHFSSPLPVRAMAFSTESQLLAVAFEDNSITIYNVIAGKPLSALKAEIGKILDLSFSANNQLIGFIEKDAMIYGVDLQRAFAEIQS